MLACAISYFSNGDFNHAQTTLFDPPKNGSSNKTKLKKNNAFSFAVFYAWTDLSSGRSARDDLGVALNSLTKKQTKAIIVALDWTD